MGANLSKALGKIFPPCSAQLATTWIHARLAGKIFGNKEMRLLMLGLDAAGKTSKPSFSGTGSPKKC